MAETVSGVVAEIVAQGSFDVDSPTVLRWLNRRHKEMVGFARAYRKTLAIDTTDAGVAEYAVPAGVVELIDVTVGGIRYADGRHSDIAAEANGWLWLSGEGGLIVESADASAATTLVIVPTPTETGLPISAYAAVTPPDLLIDDTVPLRVDDDVVRKLIAGVYAEGMSSPSQGGDPGPYELVYESGKLDFKKRVQRRVRGSGPRQIRVQGLNA